MARDMPGKKVARPAQGVNTLSRPRKPPKWNPTLDVVNATPKVVSQGKLSKPSPRPKWSPKPDRAPKVRQS